MIDPSTQHRQENPYRPAETQRQTEDEFNNELLPKPGCLQEMRWPLIVGTPIVLAPASGILAFLMIPTNAGDFSGFVLIRNFFIGCVVGGCIGLVISAAIWVATRPSSQK